MPEHFGQSRDRRDGQATRNSAAVLGLAGLIPFWGFAIAAALAQDPEWRAHFLDGAQYWAAVILAFLTGARWAMILVSESPSARRLMVFGFVPAVCLGALFLTPAWGLAILIAGYGLMLALELTTAARSEAPGWYPRLRIMLSVAAMSAMALA